MWIEYNPNPLGRRVGDCVIRAISKALDKPWEETYMRGSSYDDDMMYSDRRGRGRYAKRDSMGRYSSDGGSYERDASYDDGYSRAKDDMMSMLGEMMEDASPKEREALKECMRAIERA